ncbi:CopG family transcriptional regulator [Xenorhabdus nematophila]|uniref:CopG family transcriptional regulator n=1 Tax=Xenorhabdus nematophila TaxID=628 RepID=UPI0032B7E70E
MALKLNAPKIPVQNEPVTNADTARFIAGANKKPVTNQSRLCNFRITPSFDDILDRERERAGVNNTNIIRAALAAFDSLDDNAKNHWQLAHKKM